MNQPQPEVGPGTRRPLGSPGSLGAVVIGVSWQSPNVECDVVAFALTRGGQVPSDRAFVFFNNLSTPGHLVMLRAPSHPVPGIRHRAQVFVDLAQPGAEITSIRLALATLQDGVTLSGVRELTADVLDLRNGRLLATYREPGIVHTRCLELADLALDDDIWYLKGRGRSRTDGLEGLATSLGVQLA